MSENYDRLKAQKDRILNCRTTPPETPVVASDLAEALADALVIDPFFMLNRDWKSEVAAIITRHLPTVAPSVSDAIDAVERLYDEWWDNDRRRCLNVVLERLRALEPKPAAATTSPETPETSDASWRLWFDRMGDKASAEVVNWTANLVTNERLIALAEAGVLPIAGTDDNEGEDS